MEIHRAPGPPRTNVVLVGGVRVAVLEVGPGRDAGTIQHRDRTEWRVERPPGSAQWWIADDVGDPLGTVTRTNLVRECHTIELRGELLRVVPLTRPWRRWWSVVDASGHGLLEVVQRPFSRTVHDLVLRSGDVPAELPLTVAWVLALSTSDRVAPTRRSRWTVA